MKKIIIFGTGGGAKILQDYLFADKCEILCFADNDEDKRKEGFKGYKVLSCSQIPEDFDFIVIATLNLGITEDIHKQLKEKGIDEEKIITFFDSKKLLNIDFINSAELQIYLLKREVDYYRRQLVNLENKFIKFTDENSGKKQIKKPLIYIWGTGKGTKELLNFIYKDNCKILGFIDNDEKQTGRLYNNKPIVNIDMIQEDFDYIIIATKILEYTRSIMLQLEEKKIDSDKIIPFFDNEKAVIKNEYSSFINTDSWGMSLLNREIVNYEKLYRMKIDNLKYELIDEMKKSDYLLPQIAPLDKTLDLIINKRCSIARFGDGEFGLIDKHRFHKFQKNDDQLAQRLLEVLNADDDGCLIAIADNYGSLEQMTDRGAESIRKYMTSGAREIQMRLLNLKREYHNAYLTRPYIYFKDKENAGERFNNIKKIWDKRDIVIIEGHETRLGLGNDLLDNAVSVRRILGPSTNAFDYYDKIMEFALKIEKDALFLLALGPTATVLAYDLYKNGYQAIDIGHIDVEYEWFKMGVENPVKLDNKYVCEAPSGDIVETVQDDEYLKQIIARIYDIGEKIS